MKWLWYVLAGGVLVGCGRPSAASGGGAGFLTRFPHQKTGNGYLLQGAATDVAAAFEEMHPTPFSPDDDPPHVNAETGKLDDGRQMLLVQNKLMNASEVFVDERPSVIRSARPWTPSDMNRMELEASATFDQSGTQQSASDYVNTHPLQSIGGNRTSLANLAHGGPVLLIYFNTGQADEAANRKGMQYTNYLTMLDGINSRTAMTGAKLRIAGVIQGDLQALSDFRKLYRPRFAVLADSTGNVVDTLRHGQNAELCGLDNVLLNTQGKVVKQWSGLDVGGIVEMSNELRKLNGGFRMYPDYFRAGPAIGACVAK